MGSVSPTVLYQHPALGRIFAPQDLVKAVSLPGRGGLRRALPGEYGVVVAIQRRPIYDGSGHLQKLAMLWHSISHNERVDQGAVRQDVACFGAGTTSTFTAVAVANGTLTKAKTDLSLGSASANVTTNEYTTVGLSRAAGSLGAYTAPASLGAQFTRVISKTFTASGAGGTAYGAGLFDSTTVSGSNLYVEDNFSSTAVLVSGDTLAVSWSISN